MILDKLDPNVIASYAPEFQRAFEAIARLNEDAPLGKFEIDGDRIYGNVMEYDAVQPRAAAFWVMCWLPGSMKW